ncbi:MAG: M36 family metallopeptidase [Bryobacteraceae bacterium]
MKQVYLFLLFGSILAAQVREMPRHLFDPGRALTEPSQRPARDIAAAYLQTIAADYGLTASDLRSLRVIKEFRTEHNGITHLIFKQQFQGIDIYNAEWTVNIDRDGQVLNAGGTLFHAADQPSGPPSLLSAHGALRAAVRAVNPQLGATFYPLELDVKDRGTKTRFHRGGLGDDVLGTAVWYAYNGTLQPAWTFSIVDTDNIHSYELVVETNGESVMENQPQTWFQSAPPPPRGLVFEKDSPQANPTPGVTLTALPPYRERTVQSFLGDPVASQKGWLSGNTTVGNNVVAGENPEAVLLLTDPKTAQSSTLDFSFPLQLGLGAPSPSAFADAATTNLFYWVNRAHDLHYAAGFDEQAGNFQQQNFGRGGLEGDPMYAYSHFGITDVVLPDLDNAFFTTRATQDGTQSMIAMFLANFGSQVFTDGAFDAGVIVHEYTHGVSNRLVRQLGGPQGGAMGEAWSDFFGLEYTLPEGAPVDGSYTVGEYLAQSPGTGIRTRPYSTDLTVNPLTYARLGNVVLRPEVHADGEIWMEALWEARAALIRQFGETEGRRRIRLLVIDGMKLSPPSPSMVDARDAILLADRADFKGQSQSQLWAAFARRGLGALAQSTSTNTTHIAASFDTPSNAGKIGFYEDATIQGETLRVVLSDANLDLPAVTVQLTSSSGDLEDLRLRRSGTVYTGTMATATFTGTVKQDGALELIPGDAISAYYADADAGGGAKLVDATVPTKGTYTIAAGTADFTFGTETALRFQAAARSFRRFDLPFSFPFFGRNYRSLRLYNNGLLVFELPAAPTCIDAAGLSTYAAIAPLWMELRTSGIAQRNEDVYVSHPADSAITFRWAAETSPPAATGVPAVPVNFAATLFDDGRIRFNYGSGNADITIPSANSSCGASAPVVGIASGSGYAQTIGGYTRVADLANARPLTFSPPYGFSSIPVGQLESPAEGDTFQGVLSGSGIAYDSDTTLSAVYVLVDGVNVGLATIRQARADYCATNRVNGCPNVGFTFAFDIAALKLTPGSHKLKLRAVNSRYALFDFPETPVTIQIAAGPGRLPHGAIEAPAAGTELKGMATIRGYAYLEGLRILNLDLLVDGVTYGSPRQTVRRDDICAGITNATACPFAGFNFALDTAAGAVLLPNGPHTLQLRVLDETGRFTILPDVSVAVTVNNPPTSPPAGTLASPANNATISGTIHIGGLAYDSTGQALTVDLLIDGETRASVPYGTARTAECGALADVKLCPNIGFDLDFDTRVLANGAHTLGVRVTGKGGMVTVLPGPPGGLFSGINVSVQN